MLGSSSFGLSPRHHSRVAFELSQGHEGGSPQKRAAGCAVEQSPGLRDASFSLPTWMSQAIELVLQRAHEVTTDQQPPRVT